MPADDAGTVTPDADGTIEYVTAESGGEVTETTNIHSDLKPREEAKQAHHLSKARGHAKTAEQLKAAQAGGRMAGSITGKTIKSQKAMMKAGGAAMAGAVTGHPYHGWRVGKSMGRKSYMGGAKDWLISPNQTQAGTETDVPDATTTTPASTGRASNDQVDSVDTNYYTYR